MWSARLPGDLVGQIADLANEDGVPQADVVEAGMREWLDARDGNAPAYPPVGDDLEDAARDALGTVMARVSRELEYAIVALKCDGHDDGVVVGSTEDPGALLGHLVQVATVVAATTGRTLRVVMDE